MLAAVKVAMHAPFLSRYGWFRDELYYVSCSRRMAFGYVDHPPLSIAVLRMVRMVFGDSLWAVRLVPVLCGALQIVLAGLLASRLGAGPLGVGLAGAAVLGAPIVMAFSHHYSMNPIDGVLFTGAVLALHSAREERRARSWLLLGALLGAGLLNKASALWLGAGIAVALVALDRAALRTRGPWLAALVAVVAFLPNVVWQARHDFPTVEFARHALEGKYQPLSKPAFLREAAMEAGPFGALLYAIALVAPFAGAGLRALRVHAIILGTVLAILLFSRGSKPEYLAASMPTAFAVGARAVDGFAKSRARRLAVALPASLVTASFAALIAPLAIPVLSIEGLVRYQSALGIAPGTSEKKELGRLPHHYADMLGWPELAAAVGGAVDTLSPEERRHAVIVTATGGYGPASALDHFLAGREHPPIVCAHNNWWLWGYGDPDAQTAIVVGGDRALVERAFSAVELHTVFECGDCMPYENHKPIWIARGRRQSLAEDWPRLKHYD